MRFNRFPITRKFHSANDAQIIIFFVEPRRDNSLEMLKLLYDIYKIRADINAIIVLSITKCDLNYSEEEINDFKIFAKDNKLELIDKLRFLVKRLEIIRCENSININSLIAEIDKINNIELPQLMDEAGELDDLDSENESEINIKDQIDDLFFQAEVLINTICLDFGLENREAYNY